MMLQQQENGKITRMSVQLVKLYDQEFPEKILMNFCNMYP